MIKLDRQVIYAHLKDVYGYTVKEEEIPLIDHLAYQAETLIRNFCHIRDIPKGAVHPAVDYVCGRFFQHKINTGTLTDDEGNPLYEFSAPEASVRVGDVQVSYESGYGALSGGNAFLGMVNELADEDNFKKELVHFRKIKWKP